MPLRDDLLMPIAGENPSGVHLYFDPTFDRIREARKEDVVLLQGALDSPPKKADFNQVAKLAGQALATRSKDLRLCTWLTEATLRLDGPAALPACVALLRQLQQDFWPTCYPEIEDGDLFLRYDEITFTIAQWTAALTETPVTRSGLTTTQFHQSRAVGYEKDAADYDRRAARQAAIDAGKTTAEDFDRDSRLTPTLFYRSAVQGLKEAQDELRQLDAFQREKYGSHAPSITAFQLAIDAVREVFEPLHDVKAQADAEQAAKLAETRRAAVEASRPPEPPPAAPAEQMEEAPASVPEHPAPDQPVEQPELPPAPAAPQPLDPYAQILLGAQALFDENPYSPVPYLVCSGLRVGETRLQGSAPDPGFAACPPPEARQTLRTLASEGDWTGLLRAALPMLTQPFGRAWLDLQRYVLEGSHGDRCGSVGCCGDRCFAHHPPASAGAAALDA